jgi:AraC-like DNA-binding protein
VYETQRGRVCDQIRLLQTAQLINLSDLIDSKGKAIELLKTQTNALQVQVYVWEQTYQLNDQQHQAQNRHLKKGLLKWKLIAVAEVVLIVLVAL